MKKFICIFLSMIMLISVFAACKDQTVDNEVTSSVSESDSAPDSLPDTAPDSSTETETETDAGSNNQEESEATPKMTEISLELLSQYTIIRADDCGGTVINLVNTLKNAINETYNVNLTTGDDFYREGYNTIGEYEIIVGSTNRDEAKEFLSELKYNDYGYDIIGKKLIIAGHTDETTTLAVEHFIENVLGNVSSDTFFSIESKYLYKEEYPANEIKINGIDISKYTIVYPKFSKNNEKQIAEKLKNDIIEFSGFCLTVEDDKNDYTDRYEIIIGDASHLTDSLKQKAAELSDDKYIITSEEKLVWIKSSSVSGMISAVDALTERLTPAEDCESADFVLGNGFSASYTKTLLSTMSFNVYIGNITASRIELVTQMIKNYMPDTFGVQEADIRWMTALSEALPEYAYVGEGRDGGGTNGEYSAVFYKKDKFDLIDGGTKWLSDTPDIKGSKYEESNCVRVMSYAVLEQKSDGMRFIHVNTHLDHISSEAREKQTDVLLEQIGSLPDYPVILTGDFNCDASSAPYNDIVKKFFNASTKAITSSNLPTYHGYEGKTKIIDFIFFSSDHPFAVELYKVCNEQMGGTYASDHHPVYSEYIIIN